MGDTTFTDCFIYIDDIEIGTTFAGNTESFDVYIGSGTHTICIVPIWVWNLEELDNEIDFSVEGDHQTFSFTIKDDPWEFTLDETTTPKESEFYYGS